MSRLARYLAAVLVLLGGLVHLELYFFGYRDIPTAPNIGRAFLANAVVAAVLAVALIAVPVWYVRVAAIVFEVANLGAFYVSRTDHGLLGLQEKGLNPSPRGALTLVFEIGAIVLLALTFLFDRLDRSAATPAEKPLKLPYVIAASVVVAAATIGAGAAWSNKYGDTTTASAGSPPPTQDTATGDTATGDTATGGTEAPAAGDAITIKDFAFDPPELKVKVGATVTWTNQDGFAHSVVADDKSFQSDDLDTGKSFTHTFDAPGTFTYACGIHPSMTGKVVVG